MPGIIKRVAVNYYGRTMMYAAGEPDGLAPPDPHWFEPFSPVVAGWTLIGFFVVALAVGAIIFQRREYRDLNVSGPFSRSAIAGIFEGVRLILVRRVVFGPKADIPGFRIDVFDTIAISSRRTL